MFLRPRELFLKHKRKPRGIAWIQRGLFFPFFSKLNYLPVGAGAAGAGAGGGIVGAGMAGAVGAGGGVGTAVGLFAGVVAGLQATSPAANATTASRANFFILTPPLVEKLFRRFH